MKPVKFADGFLVYQKLFTDLLRRESPVTLWQLTPQGERLVNMCTLIGYKPDAMLLRFGLRDDSVSFGEGPVMAWVEDGGALFKTSLLAQGDKKAELVLPEELCFLEGQDIHVIKGSLPGVDTSPWRVKSYAAPDRSSRDMAIFEGELAAMGVDEEDKLFAGKREAPRKRVPGNRQIRVTLEGVGAEGDYRLFDLSRGGLAFVAFGEKDFPKGAHVHVVEFDSKRLDEPLVGEVMSVRELDGSGEWKVGVKFVEEMAPGHAG